ncbi:hypothetical protein L198_00141 [Cryptococcus wingfieldii CBS 7118]|uniref:37S ribosomal protein S35, mitochondrial n=1 Tax=Cryptococcus wingfieldii CBS 7118 TaxID=1295528 RepID=A0A1E3K5S1_9TREE|nr:hypothetical protein L198_00141 [Cryptococcus wingfieldii CBS 7118]ODO08411.1 hypothetical protein L198_00141 [Cryptococcus wingfieldii CBS 7118]
MFVSRSAIAGPSRIPIQATQTVCRRAATRRYASEAQEESAEPADELSQMKLDPSPQLPAGLQKREGRIFYQDWMRVEGGQFRVPQKGQKAKWLGGHVPYTSNPSFRPPPPLSNYTQDAIYADLVRGADVAEVSTKFNVSKSRVDAVRKLKEIEIEFQRRSLPLQRAFLEGMEPLLGVRTPINPRTKKYDVAIARDIDMAYESHPSVSAERLEEQRFESGVGQEGAFGDRSRESAQPGIERTAWEWRDEEKALEDRRLLAAKEAEVKQQPGHEGIVHEVLQKEVQSSSMFPTPAVEESIKRKEREELKAAKAKKDHVDVEGVTVGDIHFVDTSFTKAFVSENKGQKAREKRERRKNRAAGQA